MEITTKYPDLIINPNTNRAIKVGSKVYNKLVRNRLLNEEYPYVLADIDNSISLAEQLTKCNEQLPNNMFAKKGSGKYINKIITCCLALSSRTSLPLPAAPIVVDKSTIKEEEPRTGLFLVEEGEEMTEFEKIMMSQIEEEETHNVSEKEYEDEELLFIPERIIF